MTSAFLNATLEHDDWLEVGAGLRYDRYRLKGFTEVGGRKPRYIVVPGVCGYFYDDGECAYYDEDPVYGGGEAVLNGSISTSPEARFFRRRGSPSCPSKEFNPSLPMRIPTGRHP